eukprot:CAMPEP_0118635250 /NCGR_PEP_ID=MMETSP0785-20121206/1978_1 /TAXON_ID=91992 /ORGANISM="Bolidomonas pacifica, Strain CCMP 1866" /LENGTH=89 /DNA_ID=CAMNT_0006526275 /DNA_START=535 /DNA_END=801 /DNA_ORIENTATION=-
MRLVRDAAEGRFSSELDFEEDTTPVDLTARTAIFFDFDRALEAIEERTFFLDFIFFVRSSSSSTTSSISSSDSEELLSESENSSEDQDS